MIFAFVLLGIAVLFAWLCGHWFAQLLVFIVLIIPCGILGSAAVAAMSPPTVTLGTMFGFGFVIGTVVAGLLAWTPLMFHKRRARRVDAAFDDRHDYGAWSEADTFRQEHQRLLRHDYRSPF
jgi:hypothetical protein